MKANTYYLTEIIQPTEATTLCTIILSTQKHGACIEIHGNYEIATERAIVIINALNTYEQKQAIKKAINNSENSI